MDFRWVGPYRIVKALGRGLYMVESVQNEDVIPRINSVYTMNSWNYIIILNTFEEVSYS